MAARHTLDLTAIRLPNPSLCTSEGQAHDAGVLSGGTSAALRALVTQLTSQAPLPQALDELRERLNNWNRRGERVALCASPDVACALLALLDRGAVFDSVLAEQEGFLGGSATRVIRAERLREDPVDVVLVETEDRIEGARATLDALGLAPRIYGLGD